MGKAIDKAAGAEREVVGIDQRYVGMSDKAKRAMGATVHGSTGGFAGDPSQITAPATPDAAKWDGWGTALKPAHEPIVVARKPFPGTVAANVVEHGTGALNIDACRIGMGDEYDPTKMQRQTSASAGMAALGGSGFAADHEQATYNAAGRWPANVVLDDATATILDEQSGTLAAGNQPRVRNADDGRTAYGDFGGQADLEHRRMDSGGASRFFYCAKAPTKERPRHDDGTAHPTVKPLTLMRWLVRLVTPPGGTILEPFAGSGTTLEAALLEGFHAIGIEANPDYLPLIRQRLARLESALEAEAEGLGQGVLDFGSAS